MTKAPSATWSPMAIGQRGHMSAAGTCTQRSMAGRSRQATSLGPPLHQVRGSSQTLWDFRVSRFHIFFEEASRWLQVRKPAIGSHKGVLQCCNSSGPHKVFCNSSRHPHNSRKLPLNSHRRSLEYQKRRCFKKETAEPLQKEKPNYNTSKGFPNRPLKSVLPCKHDSTRQIVLSALRTENA